MNKTSIEWCDYTSNPIRPEIIATGERKGWFCTKVSAGCANCYAERMNKRCDANGNGIGNGLRFTRENESKVRFVLDEKALRGILKSRAPAGSRVFVGDMTDLFHHLIPFDLIDQVFAAMALRPDLIFMLLTKRPERMLKYLRNGRQYLLGKLAAAVPHRKPATGRLLMYDDGDCYVRLPLPNVQLGVSIEDQATADERIPLLLQTPAAVRFVSYEPALGPVELTQVQFPTGCIEKVLECGVSEWAKRCGIDKLNGIDGVIAGGESGPNARPARPDWFRQVRNDCDRAGVPFFFKQWGEWGPAFLNTNAVFRRGPRHDGEVWRIGKKAAGRKLDGRTHDDLPEETL